MSNAGRAILFSEMTPRPDFAAAFHRWYDEEHIPIRMGCSGFVSAQRYRRGDSDSSLAVYELETLATLSSDAYKQIKDNPSEQTAWMLANVSGFTRYLATETSCRVAGDIDTAIDAPLLYAVSFNVPPEGQAEFDAWYEDEHIGMLMECPEWLMVRRMSVSEGVPLPYTRLALHYLADKSALASPQRERARKTEWRDRMAANAWFKGTYTVFDRLGPRQIARR